MRCGGCDEKWWVLDRDMTRKRCSGKGCDGGGSCGLGRNGGMVGGVVARMYIYIMTRIISCSHTFICDKYLLNCSV